MSYNSNLQPQSTAYLSGQSQNPVSEYQIQQYQKREECYESNLSKTQDKLLETQMRNPSQANHFAINYNYQQNSFQNFQNQQNVQLQSPNQYNFYYQQQNQEQNQACASYQYNNYYQQGTPLQNNNQNFQNIQSQLNQNTSIAQFQQQQQQWQQQYQHQMQQQYYQQQNNSQVQNYLDNQNMQAQNQISSLQQNNQYLYQQYPQQNNYSNQQNINEQYIQNNDIANQQINISGVQNSQQQNSNLQHNISLQQHNYCQFNSNNQQNLEQNQFQINDKTQIQPEFQNQVNSQLQYQQQNQETNYSINSPNTQFSNMNQNQLTYQQSQDNQSQQQQVQQFQNSNSQNISNQYTDQDILKQQPFKTTSSNTNVSCIQQENQINQQQYEIGQQQNEYKSQKQSFSPQKLNQFQNAENSQSQQQNILQSQQQQTTNNLNQSSLDINNKTLQNEIQQMQTNLNQQQNGKFQSSENNQQNEQIIQQYFAQLEESFEILYKQHKIKIRKQEFQPNEINLQFLCFIHEFTSQNFDQSQCYLKNKNQTAKPQALQQYAQEQYPHNQQKQTQFSNIQRENQDSFNYILNLRRGDNSFFRAAMTGFLFQLFNQDQNEEDTFIQEIFINFYSVECSDITLLEEPFSGVSDLKLSRNYRNYFLNCIIYLLALKFSDYSDSFVTSELLKMCYKDEGFDFSMICFGISLCNHEMLNLQSDEVFSQFFDNSFGKIDCYQFEMNQIFQQALVQFLQVDIRSFILVVDKENRQQFKVTEELIIPGQKQTIFNLKMIQHDKIFQLIFDEREVKNFKYVKDRSNKPDILNQNTKIEQISQKEAIQCNECGLQLEFQQDLHIILDEITKQKFCFCMVHLLSIQSSLFSNDQNMILYRFKLHALKDEFIQIQVDKTKILSLIEYIQIQKFPNIKTKCYFCKNIDQKLLIDLKSVQQVVQAVICLNCASNIIKQSKNLNESYFKFKNAINRDDVIKTKQLFIDLIEKEKELYENCQCCQINIKYASKYHRIGDTYIFLNLCEECFKKPQIYLQKLDITTSNEQNKINKNIGEINDLKLVNQQQNPKIQSYQQSNKYENNSNFFSDLNKKDNNLNNSKTISQMQIQKQDTLQTYLQNSNQKQTILAQSQLSQINQNQLKQDLNQKQFQQPINKQNTTFSNNLDVNQVQKQGIQSNQSKMYKIQKPDQILNDINLQLNQTIQLLQITKTAEYGYKPGFLLQKQIPISFKDNYYQINNEVNQNQIQQFKSIRKITEVKKIPLQKMVLKGYRSDLIKEMYVIQYGKGENIYKLYFATKQKKMSQNPSFEFPADFQQKYQSQNPATQSLICNKHNNGNLNFNQSYFGKTMEEIKKMKNQAETNQNATNFNQQQSYQQQYDLNSIQQNAQYQRFYQQNMQQNIHQYPAQQQQNNLYINNLQFNQQAQHYLNNNTQVQNEMYNTFSNNQQYLQQNHFNLNISQDKINQQFPAQNNYQFNLYQQPNVYYQQIPNNQIENQQSNYEVQKQLQNTDNLQITKNPQQRQTCQFNSNLQQIINQSQPLINQQIKNPNQAYQYTQQNNQDLSNTEDTKFGEYNNYELDSQSQQNIQYQNIPNNQIEYQQLNNEAQNYQQNNGNSQFYPNLLQNYTSQFVNGNWQFMPKLQNFNHYDFFQNQNLLSQQQQNPNYHNINTQSILYGLLNQQYFHESFYYDKTNSNQQDNQIQQQSSSIIQQLYKKEFFNQQDSFQASKINQNYSAENCLSQNINNQFQTFQEININNTQTYKSSNFYQSLLFQDQLSQNSSQISQQRNQLSNQSQSSLNSRNLKKQSPYNNQSTSTFQYPNQYSQAQQNDNQQSQEQLQEKNQFQQYQGQDEAINYQNNYQIQFQEFYVIRYNKNQIKIKTSELKSNQINLQFLHLLHEFASQNFEYSQYYQKNNNQAVKPQTFQQYAQEIFPYNELKRTKLLDIYEQNQNSFKYILDLRRGDHSFFRTTITGFLISLFNQENNACNLDELIQKIFIKFYYLKCSDIQLEKSYDGIENLNKSMNYRNYFLNCILYLLAHKLSEYPDSYIICELLKMCYKDDAFDFSMICFGISLCNHEMTKLKSDEVFGQFFEDTIGEIDHYEFEMNDIYQQALVQFLQVDIKLINFTIKKQKINILEEIIFPGKIKTIFSIKMIQHDNFYKLIFDEREEKKFKFIKDKSKKEVTNIQNTKQIEINQCYECGKELEFEQNLHTIYDEDSKQKFCFCIKHIQSVQSQPLCNTIQVKYSFNLFGNNKKLTHIYVEKSKISDQLNNILTKMFPNTKTQCYFCKNIKNDQLIELPTSSQSIQTVICLDCAITYIKESKSLNERYILFKNMLNNDDAIKIRELFQKFILKESQIQKNCQCCQKNIYMTSKSFNIEDTYFSLNLCKECLKLPQIKLEKCKILFGNLIFEKDKKSNEEEIGEQIFSKEYPKILFDQQLNKDQPQVINSDQNKTVINKLSLQQQNTELNYPQIQKKDVHEHHQKNQKLINEINRSVSSINISSQEKQINEKQHQNKTVINQLSLKQQNTEPNYPKIQKKNISEHHQYPQKLLNNTKNDISPINLNLQEKQINQKQNQQPRLNKEQSQTINIYQKEKETLQINLQQIKRVKSLTQNLKEDIKQIELSQQSQKNSNQLKRSIQSIKKNQQ
ncbi:hypothetical protein ABPG74_009920 [Tetrahymena malaccensis]